MSKFDEFDLDLQSVKSQDTQTLAVTNNCTTATINSLAYCTKNGQWNTCLCSTCCTGYTVPCGG
ncbi:MULTISPECIES: hypothetical protein [Bacillus]|uniref:Lantibiotic n=1 Tax=Bacillus thuringiensis TaxID=1428 RepID=A0A9X6ZS41_BACTU|nr:MULTISPECIES: hypothetical protein [Bacillus]PFJ36907.1 hypothetical protein COJ15_21500 [Bacillus thuringiensis]